MPRPWLSFAFGLACTSESSREGALATATATSGEAGGREDGGETSATGETKGTGAATVDVGSPGSEGTGGSDESSGTEDGDGAPPDVETWLCAGFEDDGVGSAPDRDTWTITEEPWGQGADVTVTDGEAARGLQSLRVAGGGSFGDHAFAVHARPLEGVVWLRAYVRLESAFGEGHVTFAAFHDAGEDKALRVGGQNRVLMWNRESDDATLPVLSPQGIALSRPLEAGVWTCIEMMLDAGTPELRTFVEGSEVAGLHLDTTATPEVDEPWLRQKPDWVPRLVTVELGWESYAGQSNVLHYDDVALAGERIGCALRCPG